MARHDHAELSRKEPGSQRKALEAPPCRRYPPKTHRIGAKVRLRLREVARCRAMC